MKKFLLISLSTLLVSASLLSGTASAATHQHSWKYTNGGYFPTQQSSHTFNHQHSDGATYVEYCTISTNKSWYERRCETCGSTDRGEENSISHSNPHCPSSH